MNKRLLTIFAVLLFIVSGCGLGSDNKDPKLSGVYVMNEGSWGNTNASVTSYDPATGAASQNIFQAVNGRPIGDVLQSATLIDEKLFLVVNNSHKIEVVEPESFSSIATIDIPDDASPRYIAKAAEGKAYATNLYGNNVSIIDLQSLQVTGAIDVGANPEGIGVYEGKAFIANSGLGTGSTVSIINTATDKIIETVTVGDNPVGVKVDKAGRIWVVCVGAYNDFSDPEDDTPGELHILNGETGEKIKTITVGGHPGELVVDTEIGKAYLSNGSIYELNSVTMTITNEHFINRSFYALGLSTEGNEPYLWGSDPKNYNQDGVVVRYDMKGVKVDSFATGLIPGEFHFQFQ